MSIDVVHDYSKPDDDEKDFAEVWRTRNARWIRCRTATNPSPCAYRFRSSRRKLQANAMSRALGASLDRQRRHHRCTALLADAVRQPRQHAFFEEVQTNHRIAHLYPVAA